MLTDTHHPENFRIERLHLLEPQPRRPRHHIAEHTPTGVALRRLRPPRALHLWHIEGRPSAFTTSDAAASVCYTVQRAFGPWRSSGHWWSGLTWSHEEWDIDATAKDGSRILCLLTHDLLYKRWQMEALYD